MLNVDGVPPTAPPLYDVLSDAVPGRSGQWHTDHNFPSSLSGSLWIWAHNGTDKNGTIEFLEGGVTRWNKGEKQGHWTLKDNGKLLETQFNGVYHEMVYNSQQERAVLKVPVRNPPSVMWISNDQGKYLSGKINQFQII